MLRAFIILVSLGARGIRAMCRDRASLVIENLALRQQVKALKKERPRPSIDDTDGAFWVALRGIGSDSDDIGLGSRADAIQADVGLMPRFVTSSARWRKTAGAHRVYTRSSRSSVSSCPR